jgi:hypothetical protein
MSRPFDVSKFTDGPPCPKCGGTVYRRKTVCVECERRTNARRYAKRTGREYVEPPPRPIMSPERLATAVDNYRRSPSALQRSAHLDAVTRARFAKLTDDKPVPDVAPTTGGDVWRASLPVGAPTSYNTGVGERDKAAKAVRDKQNAKLRAAIKRMLRSMPDLVTVLDVIALLPTDVTEPINPSRLYKAVSTVLRDLGTVPRDVGNYKKDGAIRTVYIMRRPAHYAGLRRAEVFAAYQGVEAGIRVGKMPRRDHSQQKSAAREAAIAAGAKTYVREIPCPRCGGNVYRVNGWHCVACKAAAKRAGRVQQPRAVSGRSSKAQNRGDTPGGRTTPRRPFVGQSDQRENKIASFGAGHG